MWYSEFNGTFWLTIAGIVAGVIGLGVRACLASKCSQVSCLGFTCIRDVQTEERQHEFDLTHPKASVPSASSSGLPGSVENEQL